jgi:four helix bundle protein
LVSGEIAYQEESRLGSAQAFYNLVVWQRAIELTVCTYKLTKAFPKDELYGLISQIRRASISAAGNIAEGRGRLSPSEFRQFLSIAQGSIFEIKTQLIVAGKLGMGGPEMLDEAESIAEEVSKILASLIGKLPSGTKS